MCGEKRIPPRIGFWLRGSLPHVRGKGQHCPGLTMRAGITPAYAGKSTGGSDAHKRPQDHPRVCGEKLRKTAVSVRELGSPPRMRGKVFHGIPTSVLAGITPAYAGKSAAYASSTSAAQDHPRVCGEKKHVLLCSDFGIGSPPRMRGKVT